MKKEGAFEPSFFQSKRVSCDYCFLAIKKRTTIRATAPINKKAVRGESARKPEEFVDDGGIVDVVAGGVVWVAVVVAGGAEVVVDGG